MNNTKDESRSPEMRPKSPSTANTTPSIDDNDDIWGVDEEDAAREEVLSDLPSMKRQHMTDGYREGLSIGKARVMQTGFDKGYPIGVQTAMRVGPIFGVLEGYLACQSIDIIPGMREKVMATYADALKSLSVSELLKNESEETIVAAKTIPQSALQVISYWEGVVTAVYESRLETMAIQEQTNRYELREVVEAAKRTDPTRFDTDHTDKVSLDVPVVETEVSVENQYRRKGRKPVW